MLTAIRPFFYQIAVIKEHPCLQIIRQVIKLIINQLPDKKETRKIPCQRTKKTKSTRKRKTMKIFAQLLFLAISERFHSQPNQRNQRSKFENIEKFVQAQPDDQTMAKFVERYVETKKFQQLMSHIAKMNLLTRGNKMQRPKPYQGLALVIYSVINQK